MLVTRTDRNRSVNGVRISGEVSLKFTVMYHKSVNLDLAHKTRETLKLACATHEQQKVHSTFTFV